MAADRAAERGTSLVEIVAALAILSTALLSLVGLTWQMGRQTQWSGLATARSAALETAAAIATAANWDSLGGLVGCDADTIGNFAYTRCYSLTTVNTKLRTVTVVISPTSSWVRAETLTVQRNKPILESPLYVP